MDWVTYFLSKKVADCTYAGKSMRFVIKDADAYSGYCFFYPAALVDAGNSGGVFFRTNENWEFVLKDSFRDTNGEWVVCDEVTLNLKDMIGLLHLEPLLHTPDYLPPVDNVEVPEELLDD